MTVVAVGQEDDEVAGGVVEHLGLERAVGGVADEIDDEQAPDRSELEGDRHQQSVGLVGWGDRLHDSLRATQPRRLRARWQEANVIVAAVVREEVVPRRGVRAGGSGERARLRSARKAAASESRA